MRIIACIEAPVVIEKILTHLKEEATSKGSHAVTPEQGTRPFLTRELALNRDDLGGVTLRFGTGGNFEACVNGDRAGRVSRRTVP